LGRKKTLPETQNEFKKVIQKVELLNDITVQKMQTNKKTKTILFNICTIKSQLITTIGF